MGINMFIDIHMSGNREMRKERNKENWYTGGGVVARGRIELPTR
jgi:hypothetical protein